MKTKEIKAILTSHKILNPMVGSAKAGARNLAAWKAANPGAKAALKHGLWTFLATGKAQGDAARRADRIIRAWVKPLGGKGNLSRSQVVLLESLRVALVVLLSASQYLYATDLADTRRAHGLLQLASRATGRLLLTVRLLEQVGRPEMKRIEETVAGICRPGSR